ncbi:hypothetical protein N7533_001690 [Penicillium manginii]|uniref:uncharacterized protein n=1 Tax=Penicillium manginii TaxID=203109 RepID=UPI0025482520|nr:uncharacterized protein N7533_001690 [Penicillium manginii]KAJ5763009.1 hypothetical protein N7533_001690 [Penicillium manginii]
MCKRRSSTVMKAIKPYINEVWGLAIRKLEYSVHFGGESATNVYISRKHHLDIQPAPDAEKKTFTWRAWENVVKLWSSFQRSPLERGLVGFDSLWENELGSRSVGGFVFFYNDTPVSRRSKKQMILTISSAEAAYRELSDAVEEGLSIAVFAMEMDLMKGVTRSSFVVTVTEQRR